MRVHRLAVSALGCLALVAAWEVGAYVVGGRSANPDIVWPHLSDVLGEALPALAGVDTTGGQQLTGVAEPSLSGAARVLGEQALVTTLRVVGGTALGMVAGVALGFLLATTGWFRRAFSPVLQTLRQVPLFALTLLFVIWFGGTTTGIVVFVAFGTGLMMMVATQEAIASVPAVHVTYARTLGATRADVLRTVVAPAIVPQLAATTLVVVGLAWAMVMAAEFLGTQQGLGRLILFFQMFQLTDRMVVVAGVLTVLAVASQLVLTQVLARLTRWVPRENG
ncbi:ABC transporter permease [Jiangella sp. DSM 45060]|uniref:ABC transporter permease n=1 Tax=Jiangella sp. DSM 45060 TaxID=1798224 RepID=UPI00087B7B1C|nr:ABC transporter permease subunit [Jiangella sp. DSM 45060]SDS53334.1 sulfonate transport system permease protein [Jiangella sp. DSM 45060]